MSHFLQRRLVGMISGFLAVGCLCLAAENDFREGFLFHAAFLLLSFAGFSASNELTRSA